MSRRCRRNDPGRETAVPFAVGFRLPTAEESFAATGFVGTPPKEYEIGGDGDFFSPIPHPTCIDDWLAQYKETGQSYQTFVRENPWFSSRKRKFVKQTFAGKGKNIKEKFPDGKVYLLPLGDFNNDISPSFDWLMQYASIFFDIPFVTLPAVELVRQDSHIKWVGQTPSTMNSSSPKRRKLSRPKQCQLRCRISQDGGHVQLQVNSVLMQLKQVIPDDALCLVALTMTDLYDEPPDLFVAGMAAGQHRVAVFSFCRYDPTVSFSSEFWYDLVYSKKIAQAERKKLMLQRSCRLLVHELAHLLGVDHCIYYSCCMNGSGHLEEDFRQPMYLCPVDLHKLAHLCGFDIAQRYRNLLQFYQENGLSEDADWVFRRLEFITK